MGLLKKYRVGGDVKKVKKPNSYSITPTSDKGVQRQNQNILSPGSGDSTYKDINAWKPAYNPKDPTRLDSSAEANAGIISERDRRNVEIMKFRKGVQSNYGIDPSTMGVNDTIDPNSVYGEGHEKAGQRMIPEKALNKYYENLRWKNAYRKQAGFNQKEYYGAKEGAQKGYSQDTPLEDLNFGYRLVTGSQAAPRLQKGGLLNKPKKSVGSYQKGKKLLMKKTVKPMPKLLMKKTIKPTGYKKPKTSAKSVKSTTVAGKAMVIPRALKSTAMSAANAATKQVKSVMAKNKADKNKSKYRNPKK